jgi:integrase
VLFDTGVRVGELVSMEMPDWDTRTVVVDGKTGVRTIPLGDSALLATHRYVRRWGITEEKLWRGKRGDLTTSGVFQLVRRLCGRAVVEDKGVHAFRRAAAAHMKRLGMNDSDILQVMGWKDVTLLRRYTATVADELAQAAHLRFSPSDSLI